MDAWQTMTVGAHEAGGGEGRTRENRFLCACPQWHGSPHSLKLPPAGDQAFQTQAWGRQFISLVPNLPNAATL